MRIMFGWSKSSNMPATYIHLSGADVKKKVLQKAGLQEIETPAGERLLDPVKCPRCGLLNQKGFYICVRCNSPLTADAMRNIEAFRAAGEDPDTLIEYAHWLKKRKAKQLSG